LRVIRVKIAICSIVANKILHALREWAKSVDTGRCEERERPACHCEEREARRGNLYQTEERPRALCRGGLQLM
jgi:hypothetical protein